MTSRTLRVFTATAAAVTATAGYLTKDDILIILAILISGLQLLYDYLKNRKPTV